MQCCLLGFKTGLAAKELKYDVILRAQIIDVTENS